jgi:alpha 1,3-glucosidase
VTINENGEATLNAAVKSSLYPEINFSLDVGVHDDGVVRVRMDEVGGLRKRYDDVPSWTLVSEPIISRSVKWKEGKKDVRATFGDTGDLEAIVEYEPLKVKVLRGGKEQVVLNGRGLLHMEHFRAKRAEEAETDDAPVVERDVQAAMQTPLANARAWFEGDTEDDDLWEETFSTWTDSKPKGTHSSSPVSSNSNTSV